MEVFLRNVPEHLNDDSLARELVPFMKALRIDYWSCDKPRRRKQAWIKFLEPADGQRFLDAHGKQPSTSNEARSAAHLAPPRPGINSRPKDTPRLHIICAPIFVEKSNRPVNKHAISALQLEKEKKQKLAEQPKPQKKEQNLLSSLHRVSCGSIAFMGVDTLTFIEETYLLLSPQETFVKFSPSFLSVSIKSAAHGLSRIDFRHETIHEAIVGQHDKSLTLVLTEPPRMYQQIPSTGDRAKWERSPVLRAWPNHHNHAANCLVYRLYFVEEVHFETAVKKLKADKYLTIIWHDLPIRKSCDATPTDGLVRMDAFLRELQDHLLAGKLPFALLFQIQALVWNNYLLPSAGVELVRMLQRIAADSVQQQKTLPVTAEAMKSLFQSIPYLSPGMHPDDVDVVELMREVIDAEWGYRKDNPRRDLTYGLQISDHQVWVFRAIVTPTRILLHGPEPESKNRVLRKWQKSNDFFLRVVFSDEDGQGLGVNPRISNERVYQRYKNVLRSGITICGRHFSFLGFSHSSLRHHAVWFSAPFIDEFGQQQNYDRILKSLGDFQDIKIPAKCAARIGQAFSETPYSINLNESGIEVQFILDVKSDDDVRVFSDGVGTISFEALDDMYEVLPKSSGAPTCLQFRWGGVKGMLSLDMELGGKVIRIRKESMMKFPSNDVAELGICDTASKPLRLVLNRQLIKIMEDMGTDGKWFFDQQGKAVSILRSVTECARNTSDFLKTQSVGSTIGLPKFIQRLYNMNLDYREEPFLYNCVQQVVLQELRLLKHKARIPVEKGVTLFGVMDEFKFLKEGEIYVTFDRTHTHGGARMNGSIKDGPVLVSRSPALHPGDAQVVRMVTPPSDHPLRYLENCVVFSQLGSRDLPSQLSGGDLDGDLYHVIWDPEALPRRNFTPADYPRVVPKSLDQPVTREDMVDFFIDFMKTDILGLVAVRHMILADFRPEGTNSKDCRLLSELHSTAVDFSKTGIPVQIRDLPRGPKIRPDFLAPAPPMELQNSGQLMASSDNEDDEDDENDDDDPMAFTKPKYYASEKVLGHLYRAIDEKKIWEEAIHREVERSGPSIWTGILANVEVQIKQLRLDIDYNKRLEEAWKLRDLYDSAVTDQMWTFSEVPRKSLTEVEAFCGFILNKRGVQTRRQRDASIKLKDEMDRVFSWISKLMRNRDEIVPGQQGSVDEGAVVSQRRHSKEVIELSWACVVVGSVNNAGASPGHYHGTCELESFRIVAICCLLDELRIVARNHSEVSGGGFAGVRGGRRGRPNQTRNVGRGSQGGMNGSSVANRDLVAEMSKMQMG